MKSIATFAAIGLAATAFAGSASANHFEPKGVAYKAAGSLVIDNFLLRKATFRGNTDAGQGASVTSVTFHRRTGCGFVADGLPWRMATHATDSLTIYGMAFHRSDGFACAGDVKAQLTNLGHIVFSTNLEHCPLYGTLITRPQLSSVHGRLP